MKDEESLLKAAKNLDEDALTSIFDLYAPEIYKYTLRLSKDWVEADYITGEVFARLLDEFASGKGPLANLRSHLHQIAYQLILERSKNNQPLQLELTEEAVLDLLVEGLTDKQIAQGLRKTEDAIIKMVSNILGMVGASNRKEIAFYGKRRLAFEALSGNPSTDAPPPKKKKKLKGK